MNLIQAYIDAFTRCYPQKRVEVKVKHRNGQVQYRVAINGDDGGRDLSESDLRDATREFNRGH